MTTTSKIGDTLTAIACPTCGIALLPKQECSNCSPMEDLVYTDVSVETSITREDVVDTFGIFRKKRDKNA